MSSVEGIQRESNGEDLEQKIADAEVRIVEREKRVRGLMARVGERLLTHTKERLQELKATAIDVATLRPEERNYPVWRKGSVRLVRALDAYSNFVVERILKLSWRARAGLVALFVVGKAAIELNKALLPAIAKASSGEADSIDQYLDLAETDPVEAIGSLSRGYQLDSVEEAEERIEHLERIVGWCSNAGEAYATSSHAVSIGAITFTLAVVYWLVRRQIKKRESAA